MTEASLAQYLRVLHDSEPERGTLTPGAPQVLADTMLSRLVISKRFIIRVRQFQKLLQSPDQSAASPVLGELLSGMIAPLADLQNPYYHKIVEATKVELADQIGETLIALVAMLDLYRGLIGGAGGLELLLARLITEAGQTGRVGTLNAAMAMLNQPLQFQGQPGAGEDPETVLPNAMAVAFLRAVLRIRAIGLALAPLHQDCLRAIGQTRTPGQGDLLLAPVPLTLTLEGPLTPEDTARWQALARAGLCSLAEPQPPESQTSESQTSVLQTSAPQISEPGRGQLAVLGAMQMSPIALAWLATAEQAEGQLQLQAERQPSRKSWAREIVGYNDENRVLHQVGSYLCQRAGAPGKTQIRAMLLCQEDPSAEARSAISSILAAAPPVAPADCYAFVLRLAPDVAVRHYTNIDCCLVFDSFEALLAALGKANKRLRKKPVVLIGAASPATASHIIEAVTTFWAYAGRYVTTGISLDYDGLAGTLALTLPEQDQLIRLAAAAVSVVPLSDLLRDPAAMARQLSSGVLTMDKGFGVCLPAAVPPEDEVLNRLHRSLATKVLSPADHERLFLIGTPDHACLAPLETVANWPVEVLMSGVLQSHRQLRNRLMAFPAAPNVQAAAAILDSLDRKSTETANLAEQIDAFALSLSEHPALLLALPEKAALFFLRLVHHAPQADRIAANLSACADQICEKNVTYIVPLFEFLACCLPRTALLTTLAFTTMSRNQKYTRRYMFRIAECIRRYGDEPVMVLLLGALHRSDPGIMQEVAFIRCFHALLDSPRLPVIRAILGPEVLRQMAATVSFRDRFRQAIDAGNRAALQRMVTDKIPDFISWLDSLRGLSNELRALDLSPFVIPGISGLLRRKLAAVIFCDRVTLAEFAQQGFLEDGSALDAVAQNILGNTAPLNRLVADRFAASGIAPFTINGTSAAEVFANAATGLAATRPGSAASGPLVSVIISAFNPDITLLRLSIGSILAQTHGNVEIFVVDDASEMASSLQIQALLAGFSAAGKARIDYTRLDVNRGPYVGRNLAIAKAKGAFIAIQDADDWSHPHRFALQLAAFAATPEIRLATTPHVRIDRSGAVQMEADFAVFGDGPMTSMFRREVFDRIGAFAHVRSRGDVEMRERIRGYFGAHALLEIALPMMLCFADSATLSQKTKSEAAEYLQIFRNHISNQPPLANLRRDGVTLAAGNGLIVPVPLRPFEQEEDTL